MKTIAPKSKADAEHCLEQIANKTFDQETLKCLLMAIRECAPERTFAREMGHFVAHPVRTKGLVFDHLGIYNATTYRIPGKTVIRMALPAPMHGSRLIADLVKVVSDIGIDAKPIHDNGDGLLLCYFGLLHLATISFDKLNFQTLKMSNRHYGDVGRFYLSIISVTLPADSILHLFYSDIEAKPFFGDTILEDFDVKTMLRVVRESGALKISRSGI
jgi:hypothetical protein